MLINGQNDGLAFLLFTVAASTDWLDGQIARRTGTVTAIGKAIDPLVDRLLIASGVVGLYVEHRLPLWIPLVLVARDVALGYGVWRLETVYHRRMAVTMAGKTTTALLLIGFADLILGWPMVPGLGVVEQPRAAGVRHASPRYWASGSSTWGWSSPSPRLSDTPPRIGGSCAMAEG